MADSRLDEPGLTVAAVARRLGVAPATLRTWDRRYGLGPSSHEAGAHRRYSALDIARLEHMRRLVASGVAAADAARSATSLDELPDGASAAAPTTDALMRADGDLRATAPRAFSVEAILDNASRLDLTACTEAVEVALEERGVVWAWDHVIVPVLEEVGTRWSDTGRGVEIEHVLSSAIQHALVGFMRSEPPAMAGGVLLASAPEEQHALPLWAVAAGLAERRVGSHVLGSRVPLEALLGATAKASPKAILVWSQMAMTASPDAIHRLASAAPNTTILIAGPGWRGTESVLPQGVLAPVDLTDAIARISRCVAR